jgi:hypothetical protein
MSASALEGGQDDDDILGFPGDGFVDKTDANPDVIVEQDEEGDDARNNEVSVKKRRKSAVVASDGHVTARIKELKQKITGSKCEDNEWTKVLRANWTKKLEIVPACGTYKFFKWSREGLKQLAQDLSHSCHAARSVASKRGAETKKVLKTMCAAEDERVLLAWKAYCHGDDGTQTWSAREQDKPIAAPSHVADPLGR